jgi:hypothetical protein
MLEYLGIYFYPTKQSAGLPDLVRLSLPKILSQPASRDTVPLTAPPPPKLVCTVKRLFLKSNR